MAPVTRSSTRSSLTLAPKSSSTPALKKRRGASQARASESQEQLVWYGGQNAHQDVCIRLVRDTINNDVDDSRTLARLMVHSSRLKTCSTYFAAALSQRWTPKRKRSPQELPFYVHGDVRLYTDCFSRMYSPLKVGFESVEYSLQLLPVATHLAYDDLMSSICLYLASVCPWSVDDEMRIRRSVLSEDFPRGHAQDFLELLERRLSRDDLRPLIRSYMKQDGKSLTVKGEARDILIHLLRAARVQERSPTPTFEQEAVSVINEEFKLLLVETNVVAEAANTLKRNPVLVQSVEAIEQVLYVLVLTGMADEAVKWFSEYTSIPKLIGDAARIELCEHVVDAFTLTALLMVSALMVSKEVHVEDSVRDATLLNWLPLLDWLTRHADELFGDYSKMFRVEEFGRVKQALVSIRPRSKKLKKIIKKVLAR